MHTRVALTIVCLGAAWLASSTTTGRLGLCLGNVNPDNSPKDVSVFTADLRAIANNSAGAVTLVRTYAAGGSPPTANGILQAARATEFQVLLGLWVVDEQSWQSEKAALQAAIPGFEDQIYGITIGSEGLYRSHQANPDNPGYDGTALAGWITDAKATWPNISIGTADTADSYSDGLADKAIQAGPAMLLANTFPYWTQQPLPNATANFFDQSLNAFNHIQSISGTPDTIHVVVGETGWPADGGNDYGSAVAGTANAQNYFDNVVCPALKHGMDVFYFEAFDEPNKPTALVHLNGKMVPISEMAWGAMDVNRKFRLNMTCA